MILNIASSPVQCLLHPAVYITQSHSDDAAGVLTSDPRLVKGARPVPVLTYDEATELAFFGATVLHPQAMQPAFQQQFHDGHKLAVRVKNSYNRYAQYINNCLESSALLQSNKPTKALSMSSTPTTAV